MRDFTETQERLESKREDESPVTAEEVTAQMAEDWAQRADQAKDAWRERNWT